MSFQATFFIRGGGKEVLTEGGVERKRVIFS